MVPKKATQEPDYCNRVVSAGPSLEALSQEISVMLYFIPYFRQLVTTKEFLFAIR